MAGSVVGRDCCNKFRDGVDNSKGVCWTTVTCRGRSKSEFKEQGVDSIKFKGLCFPTAHPIHINCCDTAKAVEHSPFSVSDTVHPALIVVLCRLVDTEKITGDKRSRILVQLCQIHSITAPSNLALIVASWLLDSGNVLLAT